MKELGCFGLRLDEHFVGKPSFVTVGNLCACACVYPACDRQYLSPKVMHLKGLDRTGEILQRGASCFVWFNQQNTILVSRAVSDAEKMLCLHGCSSP